MKKYMFLAAPALLLGTAAEAQEAAVGGLRIEAMAGYDRIGIPLDEDDVIASQRLDDIDGAFFGGSVGYDFGAGGALFGIDAELTDSTGDKRIFAAPSEPALSIRFGRDLYVGGRATFMMSPKFSVYAKAGYTNLRVSARPFDEEVEEDLVEEFGDLATNLDGIRGGLGLAYAPEGRAYYGVELRYSNYENDVDRKQAALVVGYRF